MKQNSTRENSKFYIEIHPNYSFKTSQTFIKDNNKKE